jgi:hypothetical protein
VVAVDTRGEETSAVLQETELARLGGPLEKALGQLGAEVAMVRDGSLVAMITGNRNDGERDVLLRATKAAFRLLDLMPDSVIGLARGKEVDATVQALAQDAVAAVFAAMKGGGPPRGVRCDAQTARLLGTEVGVVTYEGATYVVPRES